MKFVNFLLALVVWFVTFSLLAGLTAATFAVLAQASFETPAWVAMFLGISSIFVKWGVSIWAACKFYKFRIKRIVPSS